MGGYLKNADITDLLFQLKSAVELNPKLLTGFTIGSTSNYNFTKDYYTTPIRLGSHLVYAGVVVRNVKTALKIAEHVDGQVDFVFVDAEKKIDRKNYGENDAGNIEKSIAENMSMSALLTFKANDVTVQALNILLRAKYPHLSGKNIAIVGLGNIGIKSAWSILEAGNNIRLYSGDYDHAINTARFLNYVNSKNNLSSAKAFQRLEEAINTADIIIGSSNRKNLITLNEDTPILKNGEPVLLIDVGKGVFDLDYNDINSQIIYRVDVENTLTSELENLIKQTYLERKTISASKNGRRFTRKGIVGKKGDLIVDDPEEPSRIYGICDGKGNLHPYQENL